MTEETDSNNVIPLIQPNDHEDTSALATIPIDNKTGQQRRCTHPQTQISDTNRTLQCLTCGCYLDPFDYILSKSRLGLSVVGEINGLYSKRTKLRESVANIEREEKNAKTRPRAAKSAILFAENDLKNISTNTNP